MSDFLKYWDTRIDANESFFNNYPHIANFAFRECQALWDRMEGENKALLSRHNALVEAVAWERECDACPLKNSTEAEKRGFSALWATRRAARAEVDKLLQEPI